MLSENVEYIKSASESIEELSARMSMLDQPKSNLVLRQISQQISFFPILLSQQIKMIADLDKQFGEEFQAKCIDVVREIAETARVVKATAESALACAGPEQSREQIECAETLFKETSRLNILQQRIAAKMMKSKKFADQAG